MINYKKSRNSEKSYIKWRISRVTPVVEKLDTIKKLRGQKVLEIGCGYGSLLSILNKKGAIVTGTEIDKKSIDVAKKFLNKNIKIFHTIGEKLPFKNKSFDMVILFDAIEHVGNPKKTIDESIRVLKNNGILYCEFTPYYSIIGHHLYDITKLPIHILPEKYIKKIIFNSKVNELFTQKDYWDNFKTLNKLRISKFQSYTRNLKKIEEKFIFKYPELFELNLQFLDKLGNFKDIFTLSFEGIYKKTV